MEQKQRRYRDADLWVYFRICKKPVFSFAAHLSNISYVSFPTLTGGTKNRLSMDCVITLAKYTV